MLRRLPAVYLAVVALVALARAVSGSPTTQALALTPDRLAAGKVWLFASSAVIVNGAVLPQVVGVALALSAVVWRLGARFAGALMMVAHVGATLLAYATLAVFTGDADGAHNRKLDYGVSAVWMAALGALTVVALDLRGRARALMLTLAAATFAGSVALFPLLAATEHGFAFAIGALAAFARRRSGNGAQALIGRLDAAHPGRPYELQRL